jgi:hypothetical protein
MPDWKHLVRERLKPLRLEATAEPELTEELAEHLEDHYRELPPQHQPCGSFSPRPRTTGRRNARRIESVLPGSPYCIYPPSFSHLL